MLRRRFCGRHRTLARTHVMHSSFVATHVALRWDHALHAARASDHRGAAHREHKNDRRDSHRSLHDYSRCAMHAASHSAHGQSHSLISAAVLLAHSCESTMLLRTYQLSHRTARCRLQNLDVIGASGDSLSSTACNRWTPGSPRPFTFLRSLVRLHPRAEPR